MRLPFLVGRLIVGLFYLYSGLDGFVTLNSKIGYALSKGTPLAPLTVFISNLLLLVAGLTILTGFEVHIGVAALILFFVPVTFFIHDFWNIQQPVQRMAEFHSFQSNIALMASALLLLAIPQPWPFSLGDWLTHWQQARPADASQAGQAGQTSQMHP